MIGEEIVIDAAHRWHEEQSSFDYSNHRFGSQHAILIGVAGRSFHRDDVLLPPLEHSVGSGQVVVGR